MASTFVYSPTFYYKNQFGEGEILLSAVIDWCTSRMYGPICYEIHMNGQHYAHRLDVDDFPRFRELWSGEKHAF